MERLWRAVPALREQVYGDEWTVADSPTQPVTTSPTDWLPPSGPCIWGFASTGQVPGERFEQEVENGRTRPRGRSHADTGHRAGVGVDLEPEATAPDADPRSGSRTPAATSSTSRSEEHTSELQSRENHVCRLLLEKKKRGCPAGALGRLLHGPKHAPHRPAKQ